MMTRQEMNQKIDQLRKMEAQVAILKGSIDTIKDELKAELDARNENSIDTGIHRVFYNCYERSNIDSKKLKEAGLYDLYSTKSAVIQFKITDIHAV